MASLRRTGASWRLSAAAIALIGAGVLSIGLLIQRDRQHERMFHQNVTLLDGILTAKAQTVQSAEAYDQLYLQNDPTRAQEVRASLQRAHEALTSPVTGKSLIAGLEGMKLQESQLKAELAAATAQLARVRNAAEACLRKPESCRPGAPADVRFRNLLAQLDRQITLLEGRVHTHIAVLDKSESRTQYLSLATWCVLLVLVGLGILRTSRVQKQAEDALRRSAEQFRSLVETTSDWAWEIDLIGICTYSSPKCRELLGYEPREVIGRPIFDFMPPEEAERMRGELRKLAQSGKPFEQSLSVNIRKDGRPVTLETSGVPIFDAAGHLIGYRGIHRNVTERIQAQERLRLSEERYRAIVEQQTDLVTRFTPDMKPTFVNEATCRFFSTTRERMVGHAFLPLVFPDDRQRVIDFTNSLTPSSPTGSIESRVTLANGDVRWLVWSQRAVFDEQGRVVEYQAVGRDVTDRKQAEEALRLSQERYRAIVQDQTELITRFRPDLILTFINDAACRYFGMSREEMEGHSLLPTIADGDRGPIRKFLRSLRKENPVGTIEDRMRLARGEVRWMQWTARAIFDEHDNIIEYQAVGRDITKRKQAEEALRASEADFRRLFDQSPIGAIVASADGRLRRINAEMCNMLGYTEQELRALKYTDITHPDDVAEDARNVQLVLEGNLDVYRRDKRYVHKSGRIVWGRVNVRTVEDPTTGALHFLTMVQDITARKQAEEALRRESEKLSAIISSMEEGVLFVDAENTILECNDYLCQLMDRNREESLGKKLEDVCPPHQLVQQIHAQIDFLRAAPHAEPLSVQGPIKEIEAMVRLRPLYRGDRYSGCVITVANVTDLVIARRQAEEATRAAEAANRAKSEFLANMSHEVRTPLAAIMGMVDLALGSEPTPNQRDYLLSAKEACTALLTLVNDILDFSRIERGALEVRPTEFSLRRMTRDALGYVAPRARDKNLTLDYHVDDDVPDALVGDALRLRQIIVNLADNAVKFTQQGGASLRVSVEATAAGRVCLHFALTDTGIGIPKEKQQAIFEAFARLELQRRGAGGTGIGLSISARLVSLMGGRIWVESEPGKGSTFLFTAWLRLQKVKAPAEEAPAPEAPAPPPQPSAPSPPRLRVLLAEDNDDIREIAAKMLQTRGHEVVAVPDGKHAVEAWESSRHPGARPFDAILMDIRMPEMDGLDATKVIRDREKETGEHVPIIALTAYATAGESERCIAAGMDGYLSKPFQAAELFEAVERFAALRLAAPKPTAS